MAPRSLFAHRRGSSIARSQFGGLQGSLFERDARSQVSGYEASLFERDASRQMDLLRAQQQYQQTSDEPGIYNVPGVKGFWEGTGTVLGGALDILGRPAQTVSGAALAIQEGRPWHEGAKEGLFGERSDLNFATVFERAGMENELARNLLGFAADVVTDPLNVFGIGVVRGVTAKAARGLARPVLNIPLRGKTLERRASDLTGPMQRRIARMFGQRIGAGSGDTYWEARRAARRSGDPEQVQGVEDMIASDRYLRNYRRSRDELAANEMYDAIWRERKAQAMDPRFGGMSEGEAERAAGKLVKTLSEGADSDEMARDIGWQMMQREEAINARAAEKVELGSLAPEERAGWAYDELEAGLESWGRDTYSTAGFGSLARVMQTKWGKIRVKGKEVFKEGELAEQAQRWLGLGLDQSDIYLHRFYPDSEQISKLAGSPSIKARVERFILQRERTAEQARAAGVELDFRAIWVNDIGGRRMSVAAAKIIDADTLRSAGGRKVVMKRDELDLKVQTLTQKGADMSGILDAHWRGTEAIPSLLDRFQIPEALRKEITGLLDSVPREGEGYFRRGHVSRLMLDEGEIDNALAAMGEKAPKVVEEQWILPKTIANSLTKFNSPYEMNGFLKTLDAFNSVWKPMVTVFPAFVSFFVRNATGLVQNLALSGMGPLAMSKHGAQAQNLMRAGLGRSQRDLPVALNAQGQARWAERGTPPPGAKVSADGSGHTYPMEYFARESTGNGGLSVGARGIQPLDYTSTGFAGGATDVAAYMRGEVEALRPRAGAGTGVEAYREHGGVRETLGRIKGVLTGEEARSLTSMERTKATLARYGEGMRERHGWNLFGWGTTANQGMDNTARLTHILWRLENGDTIAEASRSAAKFIGDYTELGAGTSEIAGILPFFRWTRYNVPLQVEGLLTRPYVGSKLAAAQGDKAEEERLLAEGTSLPDWVLDRHHVVMGRTPEGKLQVLRGIGLPIEDLNKIFARGTDETLKNVLSEITPLLRAPMEAVTNQSFWTGEAIDDKDDLYGFYKRGFAWATAPGISETLNQWLQVRREVNPDTGRIDYRSDNPMAMFLFASFFGRFAQTGDKWWRTVESREGRSDNLWSNLTGLKISEVYPDRPPSTTLNEALGASPYLRNLYDEYRDIPLYPQFGTVDESRRASRANTEISAFRRLMSDVLDRKVRWNEAASRWGNIGEENMQGAALARQIKDRNWKQLGRQRRKAFLRQYPSLKAALMDNLSDMERNIALDVDA